MSNKHVSKPASLIGKKRIDSAILEALESRAYLNGVVFGAPHNIPATSLGNGIAPVYVVLDKVVSTTHADMITANSLNGNNSVSILPGNGDGTFGAATTIALDFTPLTIRTAQLNPANGKTDIVVGSNSGNTFAVILQDANGAFSKAEYTATGLVNVQSVAIGDFNGDGAMDIAVASDDSSSTATNVAIFRNNGDGSFTMQGTVSVPHASVASITAFAGTHTDLAVADAADNAVTVLLNDGTGQFSVSTDYSLPPQSEPVTIADGAFNTSDANQNHDDLVTANATGGTVSVLLGNGDGTFSGRRDTVVGDVNPGGGPLKVRVANVNNDNLPDLICLLSGGTNGDAEVLLGNGDGTFHVGTVLDNQGSTRTGIAAGDLNGDGFTDVVVTDPTEVTSLINVTSQDTTAPTATVNATPVSQTLGAATIQFSVTYTDSQQVDASTLKNANVTVLDASQNSHAATLVSQNLANGAQVTATYSFVAQSSSASPADDGTYTVVATSTASDAVKNAGGVPLAGGAIGQFTVNVTVPPQHGPDLVVNTVTLRNPATAVAGTRFAGGTRVTILNSGDQVAKGRIVINLYASPTETIVAGALPLVSVTRAINLKPSKQVALALPGFKWPAGAAGTFFLVADVNATQTITETTYSDNFGISATSTAVALPFVDIQNLWSGKLPATFKAGRRSSLAVLLKNVGNTLARGTATFTIQAVDSGNNLTTIGSGTVRVVAAAGGRQTVSLPLTVPTTLAAGNYRVLVTLNYAGDTNAGNDSATSSSTFTV